MTIPAFIGCFLTAYGPLLSFYTLHIWKYPLVLFLSLNSGFCWLVVQLVSASIWYGVQSIPFLGMLVINTVFLHGTRVICYYITKISSEKMGERMAMDPWTRFNNAFGTAFGLAAMSSLLQYITQLSESMSVGIIPSSSCPGLDLYFTTAITTMLFSFSSMIVTLVSFEAIHYKTWWLFAVTFICQYLLSLASYFLSFRHDGCIYLFIIYIAFNLGGLAWLFWTLFRVAL